MTTITSHAIAVALEARVRQLVKQEQWDRRWCRADWTPARHNRVTELRALLAIRRTGKRLARAAVEREDPMTQAASWHDWQAAGPVTEADLLHGYGIDNIEGDPAFNGSFR